jgi:TatD DNase family protein
LSSSSTPQPLTKRQSIGNEGEFIDMLTDTHAHLDMEAFDKDRDDVLQRARQAGVTRIITIGIDMESSLKAVEIAEKTPGVYASVGFHPHDAEKFGEENLERLLDLAQRPKVVAWGEIGLDFFRNYSPAEAQHTAFERQLAAATRTHIRKR